MYLSLSIYQSLNFDNTKFLSPEQNKFRFCNEEKETQTEKMKILLLLLVFIHQLKIINPKIVNQVISNVIDEVKPHHVLLNTNSKSKAIYNNLILQEFLKLVPATTVDISKLPSFYNFQPFKSRRLISDPDYNSSFTYNRKVSSPLHVFLISDEGTNDIIMKKFPDFISSFHTSVSMDDKPYILIVFINSNKISEDFLSSLSINGFLDSAIIAIDTKSDTCKVVQFSPYASSSYTMNKYNSSSEIIFFSDKLKDINGCKLKIGVRNDYPRSYIDNMGYPAKYNPLLRLYKVYQTFEKHLNATSSFYLWHTNEKGQYFMDFERKDKTTYKLHQLSLFLATSFFSDEKPLYGVLIVNYQKFVALVPITHDANLRLSKNMLYAFLTMCVIMALIAISARIMKLRHEDWSLLEILGLMLGISDNAHDCLRSKILYFTLVFFSIFQVSDIATEMTTMQFVHNQKLLAESIGDVLKNNISVCSPYAGTGFFSSFKRESRKEVIEFFGLAKQKCKYYPGTFVEATEIVIANEVYSESMIILDKMFGFERFALIDFDLPILANFISFGRVSHMQRKFSKINQLVYESGIDLKWEREYKLMKIPENDPTVYEPDDKQLLISLTLILSGGYLSALIALIIELVYYRLLRRREDDGIIEMLWFRVL